MAIAYDEFERYQFAKKIKPDDGFVYGVEIGLNLLKVTLVAITIR